MAWEVTFKESVLEDLRWFGRKDARTVFKAAVECLSMDPLAESRNLKSLRPNPVAQRELRLFGKYRVLFNTDVGEKIVEIIAVGEKRGNSLIVQGKEFTAHHEGDPTE